jgi:tripartite-type tricarboxylate transporter receptor subunit TctC
MITRRRLIEMSAASWLATALPGGAWAQDWPRRVVRLIVPFPPGGGADTIARLLGGRLSEMWGQQVVIDNRAGAGGNLASEAAARSAPDGYTMYLAGDFQATNQFLYAKLGYDPVADFLPISLVVQFPVAIAVPKSSPDHSIREFIARAKADPGNLTLATPGYGTSPHLAAELFRRVAGITLTHVPYRGAAPAIQDLLGGRVDAFFNNIAPLVPLMREGQVRVLAVTSADRVPTVPEVPTLAESALPGFDVSGWYALFVPARTPPAIVEKIHAAAAAALAEPSIKGRLEELGMVVVGSTPEELALYFKAEVEKWGPVIKAAGLKAE